MQKSEIDLSCFPAASAGDSLWPSFIVSPAALREVNRTVRFFISGFRFQISTFAVVVPAAGLDIEMAWERSWSGIHFGTDPF